MPEPDVSLSVAVMTVPSRAGLLPRLVERLDPLDVTLVVDEEESGDVWRQYQRCLVEGPPSSHRLVVQDDALLVDDFVPRALDVIRANPTRVICFYTPALPSHYGRAMLIAQQRGASVVDLKVHGQFVPVVCTCWPAALAQDVVYWKRHAAFRGGPRGRADDARVADWMRGTKRLALASVPCLADHDEDVASALDNGGRYPRRAAILPDTPPGELTIA